MKKSFVLICFILANFVTYYVQAQEFSQIFITMTTGSDDLRGGNSAFISLNFSDGTSTDEVSLTGNSEITGSFGQNGVATGTITFQDVEDVSTITSVSIRHDGSPKSFTDTYDNWDLKAIRIAANTATGGPRGVNIYNSRNDRDRRAFVLRFTGDKRCILLAKQ